MAGMLGLQSMNTDEMTRKLEDMLPTIRQVNEQFKNPVSLTLCFLEMCLGRLTESEINKFYLN